MTYQRIDQQLMSAEVAIDNALADEEIKTELALFGYDEAKLTAGRALFTEAQTLSQRQRQEYGEQYAASDDFYNKWEAARTAYGRTLKVARIAFKGNTNAQEGLLLRGNRKPSFSGWFEQADTFYANILANPDFIAAMGTFGYDEAKLQAEADLVAATSAANKVQQQEMGEAQEATKVRDAKLDALDEWMADFKGIAEVALAERPQLLERLGFGAIA